MKSFYTLSLFCLVSASLSTPAHADWTFYFKHPEALIKPKSYSESVKSRPAAKARYKEATTKVYESKQILANSVLLLRNKKMNQEEPTTFQKIFHTQKAKTHDDREKLKKKFHSQVDQIIALIDLQKKAEDSLTKLYPSQDQAKIKIAELKEGAKPNDYNRDEMLEKVRTAFVNAPKTEAQAYDGIRKLFNADFSNLSIRTYLENRESAGSAE